MYIIAILVFVAGILCGGSYGYFYQTQITEIIVSVCIGGFIGSCVGAVIFTLIFFAPEKEEDEVVIENIEKTVVLEKKEVPKQLAFEESKENKIARIEKELKKLKEKVYKEAADENDQ